MCTVIDTQSHSMIKYKTYKIFQTTSRYTINITDKKNEIKSLEKIYYSLTLKGSYSLFGLEIGLRSVA